MAGLVLGVQSAPDGLAVGLLAGVNPVFGLHGHMIGTFTGAFFTSSAFMAVQSTGAMGIIVADVEAVHGADDPARALFTLSILTGLVMLGAGLLKLGWVLRFVSNAVLVGFISAVGANIVIGQLDNFSGYEAEGANRVARAFDHLFNVSEYDVRTTVIGVVAIVLIVLLERTRLGALGMVVALVVASALVPVFSWEVAQLSDIASIPNSLPLPEVPLFRQIPVLIIPAFSLAFVGLVQGAGVSANFPNPDGRFPDASRDFAGQGVANVACGVFQGMPACGSVSGTALVHDAGAKSRSALVVAGAVMAVLIVALGGAVEKLAMPALSGLLIVVGVRTVKPADIRSTVKTGSTQATVMAVTFVLTMLIALQYAVLIGVGISMILFVVGRSSRVTIKRWILDDKGDLREVDAPSFVGVNEVVVLQPYGSLFFASAAVFEAALPAVTGCAANSVVIIRLRGYDDLGSTFAEVLDRYAVELRGADCKLVLVSAADRVHNQLRAAGVVAAIGGDNIYATDERIGATLKRATTEAHEWVETRRNRHDERRDPEA